MKTLVLVATLVAYGAGCRTEPPQRTPSAAPVQPAVLEASPPAPDSTSMRLFRDVMEVARAEGWHVRPLGEVMQAVGLHFLGTPYVAGQLDEPAEETLVASLTGFDCVLLVETALAMGRGIVQEDYTYATFLRHLEDQRYRDGAMNGYCSRLHYFTEWIANNAGRGTVADVTADLGGVLLDKRLTFMSEHRAAYPRFASNDSLFQGIRAMEDDLADLEIYYIPQARIRDVYDRLRPGDIIATATDIGGLDVTHSGLVYVGEDGGVGFLHASTSGGVKVSPDLQRYIENNKKQIGIVVARPVDPRRS